MFDKSVYPYINYLRKQTRRNRALGNKSLEAKTLRKIHLYVQRMMRERGYPREFFI